jgi:two-component system, chemotaxis family, protein-glutamate methylesterase/glutaminase
VERRDLIVIGGSAGAVEAMLTLASLLPDEFPAALFLVIHLPENAPTVMPHLLRRRSKLVAAHPLDGEEIRHGHVYVAPPNRHLLVEDGRVRVVMGPRENGHRPAVDPLFRSAALAYGPRVIGVVLSGNLDDGTAGLQAIKSRHGVAIAQDPAEALYASMPRNAIERAGVDHVLGVAGIADALIQLTREMAAEPPAEVQPMADELEHDVRAAGNEAQAMEAASRPGKPSGFTCPECHGALWEIEDGELGRYRCRVGHAYSADTLLNEQGRGVETALWIALRSLEENAMFCRRLARRTRDRGNERMAQRFEQRAEHAQQQAALIRAALETGEPAVLADAAS